MANGHQPTWGLNSTTLMEIKSQMLYELSQPGAPGEMILAKEGGEVMRDLNRLPHFQEGAS